MKKDLSSQHKRVAIACTLFFSCMLGLSYAAVPFYTWFCKTTGFGGTPKLASSAPARASEQTINVRFDSNVATDMPWKFEPKQREMRVKLGQLVTATYVAENLSSQPVTGLAIYNVLPELAGGYFNKLDCFCFTQQVLKPHEKRDMTLSFFVDPDVVKDKGLSTLDTITLSYTFYNQSTRVSQLGR